MRPRLGVEVSILLLTLAVLGPRQVRGNRFQADHFGPEVKAFLELMRQEETELDFQVQHAEIARKEYIRSKSRIEVLRQTVVNLARRTGEDWVPELYAVVASEINQIVESGVKNVKGLKVGTILDGRLRYLGSINRGEVFYIFERLSKQ